MPDIQNDTTITDGRQAQSLTESARKVAGAIFESLDATGTAKVSHRVLGTATGLSQARVTAAVRELEAGRVIAVARAATGNIFRWLTGSAPAHRAQENPIGVFRCARGSAPAHYRADDDGSTEPEPETRIGNFRRELSPDGRHRLDQIHLERGAVRREADALWREIRPDKRKANLAELARAIAHVVHPVAVRSRAEQREAARAAEAAIPQRGGHPELSDDEFFEGQRILREMKIRFCGDTTGRPLHDQIVDAFGGQDVYEASAVA